MRSFIAIGILLGFHLPLIGVAKDFAFEKELIFEKHLEERVNNALANFLNPPDFILIADVKLDDPLKKQKEKRSLLFDDQDQLENLDLSLPGVIDLPLGSIEDNTGTERIGIDGELAGHGVTLTKIILTLFLDKDVPETKTEVIQAIIIKTAQLDLNRGDELNIRIIDFESGGAKSAKSLGNSQMPDAVHGADGSSLLETFGGKDKTLVYLLVGLLSIVILLFILLLLKNKRTTYDYRYQPPGPDPYARNYPPQYQEPTQRPQPIVQPIAVASEQGNDTTKSVPAKNGSSPSPKFDFGKERKKQDVINMMFSRPEALRTVMEDILREEGGLRTIAALVKVFGPETAKNLFSPLDSSTVNKIFSYYVSVDVWNDDEADNALGHFEEMLRNHKIQHFIEEVSSGPFGFVKKMSDQQISYLLKGEDLPVLALFLAHLAPHRAAKVLSQMDDMTASAIVAEIGNLQYVNVEVINAVGRRLAEKSMSLPQFDFYPGSGINTLVQILDNLDPAFEKSLLNSLKDHDSKIAANLKKAYFTFEDINLLAKDYLKIVIKEVPRSVLATSLVGGNTNVVERILSVLPERRAEMLKFDIEKQQNIPANDIVKAQKLVIAKIREMIKSGELDLTKATKKEKPEMKEAQMEVPATEKATKAAKTPTA